jgi:uncharacterized protein YcbX
VFTLRHRTLVRIPAENMSATPRIAALYCYPVKSARGWSLVSTTLVATGLQHDRQWMLVDERRRFLTQRELPQLATLEVALDGGQMQLHAPGQTPLRFASSASPELAKLSACRVQVWNDECAAFDCGDPAAAWLSTWLQRPIRLVRFDECEARLSNPGFSGAIAAPNHFSDGYPLLVANRSSLDDLCARMGRELPMERFRPNIVLEGLPAYAEDEIRELQLGAVRLRLVKACTRCVITTTDQRSGERDGEEPLRTLKAYRFDPALKGVTFAQNAVIVSGVGAQLRVGDTVSFGP